MMNYIRIILKIINTISLVCVLDYGIIGFFDEIFGPGILEKVLECFNIPWSYNQAVVIGYISLSIMIITYLVRRKIFGG